ncbi:hypothetical protein IIA15_03120 [candidate division TA06 bacterium]|nr:hypothetical protein [candidate division TA06 bacterium]
MPKTSKTTEGKWTGWSSDFPLPVMPFEEINEPGAYLDVNTGNLFRIPPEALRLGHSPVISVTCNGSFPVCRLSDDPYMTRVQAKTIAADHNLWTNF